MTEAVGLKTLPARLYRAAMPLEVFTGGTIFNRKGKRWEVLRTTIQRPNVQPEVMPVLKIYLTDQF